MKKYTLIFLFLAVLIAFSCKKENMNDCFTSRGLTTVERRNLDDFRQVKLGKRIHLVLIEDTVNYAVVEAGKNLLPEIITSSDGQLLTIENRNKCNWVRTLKDSVYIKLHYTNLYSVEMKGASIITNQDTLRKSDTLRFEFRDSSGDLNLKVQNKRIEIIQHTGASNVNIKGKTDDLSVYMSGLGWGDYSKLTCRTVYVDTRSAADVKVYATTGFDFRLRYSGDIYYKGPGTVQSTTIIGDGKIVKLP
ncbi:MAG: DUF2807 domain-containing protein [Bacteroidota bacterium]|jgi:hypothetical protein